MLSPAPLLASSPDKLTMFRDKARQIADSWVDSLAPELLGKPMTMAQISALFEERKADLTGALVKEFIGVHHQESLEQQTALCPQCEKVCRAKRRTSRMIETRHGMSSIERPYFLCKTCRIGFSQLDQTLELSARRKQYDLQRLALEYIAEMPYAKASELFEKSTGISFSEDTMHNFLEVFTSSLTLEDALPSAEEIAERIASVKTGLRRPVLVVATDGAHVPTRPLPGRKGKRGKGEYREAKGFRLYLLGGGNRIVQVASWHQIMDADTCAAALKQVAERIPMEQVRIALVGDGAPWVWNAMTGAFPQGRQVLDYYHCSEHIHDLAQAQYADDPLKGIQWAEATMSRLYYGEVGQVLGGLKRMKPKNDVVKEQIRKLIGYLQNNAERIDYGHNRRGGYAIGSGGIESANKFICHSRLKRSGAWWLKENSNGMLALRCAIVNGTLDNAFNLFVERDLKKPMLGTNS